jgi:Predicted thioesterase
MDKKKILRAEKDIDIRFNEVDSMGIVWHGNYTLYFEDARETFGKLYQLEYLYMYKMGFYAPLVDLHVQYKRAIKYQDKIKIIIEYHDTEAAKIVFDYTILNRETNEVMALGQTTQVFLNHDYELMLQVPEFFIEWKRLNGII